MFNDKEMTNGKHDEKSGAKINFREETKEGKKQDTRCFGI